MENGTMDFEKALILLDIQVGTMSRMIEYLCNKNSNLIIPSQADVDAFGKEIQGVIRNKYPSHVDFIDSLTLGRR